MSLEALIRPETSADIEAIGELTREAFATLAISQHTEPFIVAALRAAGALTVSLVAELDGRLVGHIAFSPVSLADGCAGWYGLGPLSVRPAYQRQGIGSALVRQGLAQLQALAGKGCCLVGHPHYYRRLGFVNPPGLTLPGVPPEVFMALSFDGHWPQGTVAFHEGFLATGPQAAPRG
ncbi:GNAT family N-acetyltransferase [Plasticicumulans acidivorans]|uniref:Putative acetyltransferase n=1 Tax=Plasticicumulans acidivorans TaxID=886464 RepID=A0A317MRZ2_9GAMM|nr:N-acetyltransferase [Plasticicumulans acidivorans]PWV59567.1 putative acetyltransferase [Plasticicumulans acidivorans]